MSYTLCYDLETTGLKYNECEIVQFSAIVLDNNTKEEVETINIFHATPVSDFLLELHGKTQEFYDQNGMKKTEFINAINMVFEKYNITMLMGHNIIGFDNKWLEYHCNLDTTKFSHIDTMKLEQKLLNCDDYGNVLNENGIPTGEKVKRTLKESCIRRGVKFDEEEAHDGLYDCTKTLELYFKHKELKSN